jgi:hypothetical protein
MEKHPIHLKIPELQKSPEVGKAVEKQERLTGENVPNNPNERIEAYMDRLENVFLNPDERVRERNLDMFQDKIYDAFIIKRNQVPESYFELQKRIARERGQTVEEIPADMREQIIGTVIEDQKASLDAWIGYLTSDDAVYPAWYKYFVFRNVVKLSQFDKELGKFKERTESTVAPFPDIYREPLAQILDVYEKVAADNKALKDPEIQRDFSKKFPTLYADFIQQSLAAQFESKEDATAGEWIKYERGNMSQAAKLYDSLQGKGTGWCTAGRSTAETQVESGDFYVYYTHDESGKPSQPRVAIRMEDDQIGEVRGILPHQQLEPQMAEILETKLQDFGSEANTYKKKSRDMRLLTELEKKTSANEALTKDELIFLYEINEPIEGFGYEEDPRVEELRSTRDAKEDAPLVLGCAPEEIAWRQEDISENSKAYIGPLFKGIFDSGIEHIYTSFPEGNLQKYSIEIGGKTKEQLQAELKEKEVYISQWGQELLDSKDFETASEPEHADLVRLTVEDLGFPLGATTDEIYAKAAELGLELCPAEVGPQLRLAYTGNDWMYIGMKQITDRGGYPFVFFLREDGGELELFASHARADEPWDSVVQFVFRHRKTLASSDS